MTQEEMQARILQLEQQLEAVLRVLWAMHNENKGIANKIEKELKPIREQKPIAITLDLQKVVVE